MEGNPPRRLRVGLLLDSFDVPAWQYKMLEILQGSAYAEVVLIVQNTTRRARKRLPARIVDQWSHWLYIGYRRLDNRLFRPRPDAFASKDLASLLDGVPVLPVQPRQTTYSDWIEDRDVDAIEQHDVDVLIRMGFRILRGRILRASRYGVWSYHHGDNQVNRGGPAGFWEVFERHPVTGSILQILTEDLDNGVVLYRSYSATDPVSVRRNRNNYYWKSMAFLPRQLAALHRMGEASFFASLKPLNEPVRFYSSKLYRKPTNGPLARLLFKHVLRYARRKAYSFFFVDQWILMFDLRDGISSSFWRFKRIVPRLDRFWADPFVLYKEGSYYLFFEEFMHKSRRGRIALMVMDEAGVCTEPAVVVEQPYHLAYPFLFEWEGAYYLLADTSANNTIEVYRCVRFPDEWVFHKVLMDHVKAVDPTLFFYQGTWWLFVNCRQYEGASTWDELFLFSAETPLTTTWTPHPLNPIVSDVRRARPAGRIFEYEGALYRPSQDCSKGYGHSIKLNRIVKLSPTEYEEEEVSEILPDWSAEVKRVHTFNHENRLTIIDGKVRRFRFSWRR